MTPLQEYALYETRRRFLSRGKDALGMAALAMLGGGVVGSAARAAAPGAAAMNASGLPVNLPPGIARYAARAKRVIYLHMVGGPPQMDLYDYKPQMNDWYDKDLPDSIRKGQRLTTMTSGQTRFPVAPSKYKFTQHGKNGMWVTELLPWTAKMVDDMCFIRTMNTDAINHEPAITFQQTGNQITGKPCLGSWVSYGLGSMNNSLPTFVVLVAQPTNKEQQQAISAKIWSSGFLSGVHAGVSLRSSGDPILYINNPSGVSTDVRRRGLDALRQLNEMNYQQVGDPETHTRIEQYELAFRMQASVPELIGISAELESTFKLYGEEARKPGTFAATALLARRLVERGVRFVQVYHNNWDTHGNVAGRLPSQCKDVDQACYALVQDLKQRGMLDDTLIIWGGEFGRTIYSQGGLTHDNYGRDHHPRCYTMWMAGGGCRAGHIYGETDDFSYNIVKDPVTVHDFHATVLRLLGIDHERFAYRYQGLDQRLSGVELASIVPDLIA
jgi:hypothetical protein